MSGHRILTIEDDAAIRRGIVAALRAYGYIVYESDRGDSGLEIAKQKPADLILLDLSLPGKDGLEVLREIRFEKPSLPVIILTARGDENDRVQGLRTGADDYVVKPFSVNELVARVQAVLRRSPARPKEFPVLAFASGTIDWERRLVRDSKGSSVDLSERESELLEYFARHPDRVLSREELLRSVWQIDSEGVTTRTVDVHVARLREKLATITSNFECIETIRGRGYVLHVNYLHSQDKPVT